MYPKTLKDFKNMQIGDCFYKIHQNKILINKIKNININNSEILIKFDVIYNDVKYTNKLFFDIKREVFSSKFWYNYNDAMIYLNEIKINELYKKSNLLVSKLSKIDYNIDSIIIESDKLLKKRINEYLKKIKGVYYIKENTYEVRCCNKYIGRFYNFNNAVKARYIAELESAMYKNSEAYNSEAYNYLKMFNLLKKGKRKYKNE